MTSSWLEACGGQTRRTSYYPTEWADTSVVPSDKSERSRFRCRLSLVQRDYLVERPRRQLPAQPLATPFCQGIPIEVRTGVIFGEWRWALEPVLRIGIEYQELGNSIGMESTWSPIDTGTVGFQCTRARSCCRNAEHPQ